jgi:hypothetical protein
MYARKQRLQLCVLCGFKNPASLKLRFLRILNWYSVRYLIMRKASCVDLCIRWLGRSTSRSRSPSSKALLFSPSCWDKLELKLATLKLKKNKTNKTNKTYKTSSH